MLTPQFHKTKSPTPTLSYATVGMPPSYNISISSPWMRLNDDVLREIFLHCVCRLENGSMSSQCFELFENHKRRIHNLPQQLIVSRVCSSWRHVALFTPQLWDNIYISDWTEATLRIARQYLSRDGNIPISISLSQGEIDEDSWRPQVIDFLSSYRIRAASIWNCHLILPHLPQRSVADLETLVLTGSYTKVEEAEIDLSDTRYPKLAILRGTHTITGSSSSLRVFSNSRLSMTVIEGWNLLSRCPSLEECYITITRGNSGWPVSVPRIYLPNLRKLYLFHSEAEEHNISFSIFIEALVLPVIEKLLATCDGLLAVPALQSLAHRSNHFPHLTSLSLICPNSVVDVGVLLALTPSLKSIWLSYDGSVIFENLTLNGLASGSLAPRLRSLDLDEVSNIGLFLDMVESRMNNAKTSSNGVPASLTSVTLSVRDGHAGRDRLQDMQLRGIPISAR